MPIRVSTLTSTYQSEPYLSAFLDNFIKQTMYRGVELILNMSAPSDIELEIVDSFRHKIPHLTLIRNPKRIPIYRAWNESLKVGTGNFFAVWNVDDLRTFNSLELQYTHLLSSKDVAVTGSFCVVSEFGSFSNKLVNTISLEHSRHFSSMALGPFFMFDKSTLETLEGFDEQFEVASDFDFAVRLASVGSIGHVDQCLGSYLNTRKGISTRSSSIQPIERDAILIRYSAIHKIQAENLPVSTRFDLQFVRINGARIELQKVMKGLDIVREINSKHWKYVGFREKLPFSQRVLFFGKKIREKLRFELRRLPFVKES